VLDAGCSARRRHGGPPPRGLAQRSAANPGTRCGPSESTAPRRRSRWAPCTGVTSTSTPSDPKTSSNPRQNFASRSRIRKRVRRPRSSRTSSRLRACWVIQAALGFGVTPARWTRRVSSSMKNSTYSRRSQIVSTVKKSQATISAACWRRNTRQVVVARRGAGSSPWRRSVVRIAVAETRIPSRWSSPWMRW
jgi:hypothetical protein